MSTQPPDVPQGPPAGGSATPVSDPPAETTTPPPTSPPQAATFATLGDYFKSSKQKTIALIVAGVLVIGAIGALIALAFGGGDPAPPATGISDESVFDPQPIDSPTPSPIDEPDPDPAPTVAPESPPAGGDSVTIGGGVEIPVPNGWKVEGRGQNDVFLVNGKGTGYYALTDKTKATDAIKLRGVVEKLVLSDKYSNITFDEPKTLKPFGTLVSFAVYLYEGTFTDQQSSMRVVGEIVIVIRQDGTYLVLNAEHTPPKGWNASVDSWFPISDVALDHFAGLG